MLTTHPDNFTPITLLHGLSDHLTVHTSFYCNVLKKQENRKTLILYDKEDYVSINRELTEYFHTFAANFQLNSLESNWLLFKTEMHRLIRIYIPTIIIREKINSPWFNVSLKRPNNKKKRLFRAAKRANCASTWQKYYAVEKEYYNLTIETKRKFFSNTLRCKLTRSDFGKQFIPLILMKFHLMTALDFLFLRMKLLIALTQYLVLLLLMSHPTVYPNFHVPRIRWCKTSHLIHTALSKS